MKQFCKEKSEVKRNIEPDKPINIGFAHNWLSTIELFLYRTDHVKKRNPTPLSSNGDAALIKGVVPAPHPRKGSDSEMAKKRRGAESETAGPQTEP